MSEPKPTAAAMRIAARMFEGDGPVSVAMICELAGEIDGLAHLPEIWAALQVGLEYAENRNQPPMRAHDIRQIRTAIKLLVKP